MGFIRRVVEMLARVSVYYSLISTGSVWKDIISQRPVGDVEQPSSPHHQVTAHLKDSSHQGWVSSKAVCLSHVEFHKDVVNKHRCQNLEKLSLKITQAMPITCQWSFELKCPKFFQSYGPNWLKLPPIWALGDPFNTTVSVMDLQWGPNEPLTFKHNNSHCL